MSKIQIKIREGVKRRPRDFYPWSWGRKNELFGKLRLGEAVEIDNPEDTVLQFFEKYSEFEPTEKSDEKISKELKKKEEQLKLIESEESISDIELTNNKEEGEK